MRANRARVAGLCGILLALSGCLVLPTAPYRVDPTSRRRIQPEQVKALAPGVATRADVLLALGDPEMRLDGERLLLYQWGTASGLFLSESAGGPLASSFHDLLFEFDDTGLLRRSGDLKSLLAEGWQPLHPLDPVLPREITVHFMNSRAGGMLLLEPEILTAEIASRKPACHRIPRGSAVRFGYRSDREGQTTWPARRYDLETRDEKGEAHTFSLSLEAGDIIPLVLYLKTHSPAIRIES